MGDVLKFYPKDAAESPDVVLERAAGVYQSVIVIGRDKNGDLNVRASLDTSLSDILYLMEQFKFKLMSGDYLE